MSYTCTEQYLRIVYGVVLEKKNPLNFDYTLFIQKVYIKNSSM